MESLWLVIVLFIRKDFAENVWIHPVLSNKRRQVNFISSHGFDLHQFCKFLSEIEAEYLDVP